mmetsp:Transcript_15873/g.32216  ORF Transcript_15873/g.32216 Transcript_15873/m.32216 type:complete len:84 (-) Transcript_15873:38-289(-)
MHLQVSAVSKKSKEKKSRCNQTNKPKTKTTHQHFNHKREKRKRRTSDRAKARQDEARQPKKGGRDGMGVLSTALLSSYYYGMI